jgi:hypothetical protein
VKLCVNLIADGRYVRAGQEVAEADVPEFARVYAVAGNGEPPVPPKPKRSVKRRVAWQRAKDKA